MALLKKTAQGALVPHGTTKTESVSAREAEAQRKRARTLAKQQQAAERIAAATAQLASGITEASSAVEELKRASDQIAAGAQEASGASQECLAAFKQVAQTVNKQMQNAQVSKNRVESAQALVAKVTTEILGLVKNVGVAAERQENSVKMVKELEQQASNIGDIVKAVGRIADQTNLLALNAAIEAARAGEFGKGFAVVATDIRNLAHDSAGNAEKIKDMVKAVQDQISIVSNDIQDIMASAVSEAEKAKTTTEALISIESEIKVVKEGANDILNMSNELVTSVGEIKKAIEQIAAAAQEADKASTEAAAAAKEQSQAAEELAAATEEIASLADELQSA